MLSDPPLKGRVRGNGSGEICARQRCDAFTELVAQHARAHFLHCALVHFPELKRAIGNADQPVHLQPEMLQHITYFAVLAFADGKGEPDIGALFAVERGFDGAIAHAGNLHAIAQRVEFGLGDAAMRSHAIAPQPAGLGQLQYAREAAVIGEQQQAFGVEIKPANADQARKIFRQRAEYGGAAFRIAVGRDQPARLVIEEEPGALALRQRRTVDHDHVGIADIQRGRGDDRRIDAHASLGNPLFGLAARAQSGAGDHLGHALG